MTAKPGKRSVAVDFSPSTALTREDRTTFSGFVYDLDNPSRKFTVDLLIDGLVAATAHCDGLVASLLEAGIGDGCYGFTVSLPQHSLDTAKFVEARLANSNTSVGRPLACATVDAASPVLQWGDLKWLGGLRFDGWLALDSGEDGIDVLVDQQPVMRVRPAGWSHVEIDGGVRPAKRVDFHLPEWFADGRVHRLTAMAGGRGVTPHALAFVAFDNGLEETLKQLGRWESEQLRGRLFEQLVPASLPFSAYQDWRQRFPLDSNGTSGLKAAVVLVGDHHRTDETVESLEGQSHAAWTAISLPSPRGVTQFDAAAALEFLSGDASDCDFVLFCLAGTVLFEHAVQTLAQVFDSHDDCRCIYPDADIQMEDGSIWPLAFPAFDVERMLEQGYAAHIFAVRRDEAIASLSSARTLYDLFPLEMGVNDPASILHLPGSLAVLPPFDTALASAELATATRQHLDRLQCRARVEQGASSLLPAVRVRRYPDQRERVAIMIPTRNRAALLSRCIASIEPAAERCGARIVIIDNDSQEQETLDYFASVVSDSVSVIHVPGPFNFARINNAAARELEVDHLCLLNNDIEALDEFWLSEMLSRLVDPSIGAVGAKLLWPSGIVQHGGVVLGPSFAAAHAFNDRMDGDPGYADMLNVAHECSAVTAACLLLRRSDYFAVGGMDDVRFPVNFNDVDLCLKLRQQGKRIVFTPHAKLLHLESASRGKDEAQDRKARFERELRILRAVWGEALLNDAYYNPVLALDPTPYSALAWPPRNLDARSNASPQPVMLPPGF